MTRGLGWMPDLPDHRDYKLTLEPSVELPPSVDLSPLMPPIQDQGDLGSCTAHAVAAAHEYQQIRQSKVEFSPSRLFIYYNTRVIEGTVKYDAGASLRNSIKSVARYGACDEEAWAYDIGKYRRAPAKRNYTAAMKNQAVVYRRLERGYPMMNCLASGMPFVFGFSVYDSFISDEVAATGYVPMPAGDEKMLGGHAVLCVGYDEEERVFRCRNSWGADWGNAGYFYVPYEYLLDDDLSDDFWAIALVE